MGRIFQRTGSMRSALFVFVFFLVFLVGSLLTLATRSATEALAQDTRILHLPIVASVPATQDRINVADSGSQDTLWRSIYFVNAEIPNCAPLLPQFGIGPPRQISAAGTQAVAAPNQGLVEYALVLVINDPESGNSTLCGLTTAQRPLAKAIKHSHAVQNRSIAIEELVISYERVPESRHSFACRELAGSTDDERSRSPGDADLTSRDSHKDDFPTELVAILGEEFLPGFGIRDVPEITVSSVPSCTGGPNCPDDLSFRAQSPVVIGKFDGPPELELQEARTCGALATVLNGWSAGLFAGEPDQVLCLTRPDGKPDTGRTDSAVSNAAGYHFTNAWPSKWKGSLGACSDLDIDESRTAITVFVYDERGDL